MNTVEILEETMRVVASLPPLTPQGHHWARVEGWPSPSGKDHNRRVLGKVDVCSAILRAARRGVTQDQQQALERRISAEIARGTITEHMHFFVFIDALDDLAPLEDA